MTTFTPWLSGLAGTAAVIPAVFGSASLLAPARRAPLELATRAAALAFALALLIGTGYGVAALAGAPLAPAASALGLRLDVVTAAMLVLVTGLALVISRYSQRYLHGDPGQARYARWLLATLAAVATLVITANLWVLAAAWLATSIALHQLLTFYADRPAALVAAHKKFLVSRLADACMLGAIALLSGEVGSARLDAIERWASAQSVLSGSAQTAAVLFVVAVALKSAQLPFHGWLMQVMEAPTPVSALLHAGVVNIGGFLMIRLSPLMARAELAQLLLIGIGLTTTLLAALVMTTRVSIKVALAWSTCAQMGFMLVQCGLGMWHLALLHLLAHSLYKAHAFLASGGTVDGWRVQALLAPTRPASSRRALAAVALVGASVGGVVYAELLVFGRALHEDPTLLPLALVLALGLVPFTYHALAGATLRSAAFYALGFSALYFGWHEAFRHALVAPAPSATATLGSALVAVGFAALFVVQIRLQGNPNGRLARALHPLLFAGFYLDELFTRVTFLIWPPRFPAREPGTSTRIVTVEA